MPFATTHSGSHVPRRWRMPFVAATLCSLAGSAWADLSIQLRTDADIANLYLDQAFTVEVVVSGLQPGEELVFLGVTVTADAFRMGTPANIQSGEVVPAAPASGSDFLVAAAPGLADASFECSGALASHRIRSNGVFFTFELTPRHAGDVSIEVSFADALLHNQDDPTEPQPMEIAPPEPLGVVIFCPADFNQDGGIDGSDVSDFFAAWETSTGLSDVNGDGGVDGADVARFFEAWEFASC
jgi:hypothetical protein